MFAVIQEESAVMFVVILEEPADSALQVARLPVQQGCAPVREAWLHPSELDWYAVSATVFALKQRKWHTAVHSIPLRPWL